MSTAFTLDISIGSNSSNQIYASRANGSVYTSNGYQIVGTPVDPVIIQTTDLVTEDISQDSTSTSYLVSIAENEDPSGDIFGLTATVNDITNNRYSSVVFSPSDLNNPGNGSVNVLIILPDTGYFRTMTVQEQGSNTIYSFLDETLEILGTVIYSPTTNSFSASSNVSSFDNYLNIFIVSTCAMSAFFYNNPPTDSSNMINATYAMIDAVFNEVNNP